MIDAGEAPFEHGPKALNAVGVDFSIGGYVLLHAVVDRLTVRQRTVGGVFVRVNAGAGLKPLMHNVVGLAAGAGNSLWPPLLDELGFRYVIIRELLQELSQRERTVHFSRLYACARRAVKSWVVRYISPGSSPTQILKILDGFPPIRNNPSRTYHMALVPGRL